MASRDGREDSILIRQDANIFASLLDAGKELTFNADADRYIWIQLAKGSLSVNGEALKAGDGVAIHAVSELRMSTTQGAEFLLFDLA